MKLAMLKVLKHEDGEKGFSESLKISIFLTTHIIIKLHKNACHKKFIFFQKKKFPKKLHDLILK